MTEKRYRVHDFVKFNYSEIGEYIDENHTDRPLRNDEVVELLNELHEERNYFERKKCEYWNKFNLAHLDNINLRKENEQLKQREENLLSEIDDFKDLLSKNDGVCHKRVIGLIDDRISNFSNVRAELLLHSDDDYRLEKLSFAIQNLRELKKELEE